MRQLFKNGAIFRISILIGGTVGRLYLIGCTPADLGGEEGRIGLSTEVERSLPKAVEMVRSLVAKLLSDPEQETVAA